MKPHNRLAGIVYLIFVFGTSAIPNLLGVTSIILGTFLALAEPASAALTVTQDHAFIDNRPSNDPLLTGLNLSLEVTPTDSVGGSAALGAGTATFTSSNLSYPFSTPTSMTWNAGPARFGATVGVTSSQFTNIAGSFTFTVTDVNGTAVDTSHPLDYLTVLSFPTNLGFSDNSTTPTFTFADPNSAPPSGITRGYEMNIFDATSLSQIYGAGGSLTPSFTVPSGVLVPGHTYDFRADILDVDTAEACTPLPDCLKTFNPLHDPVEDRSVGWAFNYTPVAPVPIPAAAWLFSSGLLGLIGVARRRKIA